MYFKNRWVSFLRQYGPVPSNDNMYDEHIQKALSRHKIQPIRIQTGDTVSELLTNFQSDNPCNVILTGTAGDGKTYLCRELWLALGGAPKSWESNHKIHRLPLGTKTLYVVRDLSELAGQDLLQLSKMATAVLADKRSDVFLIAANDGQLIEAWSKVPASAEVGEVQKLIEELLVQERAKAEGKGLWLYNLSRVSSAELAGKIMDAIKEHPGWQDCNGCDGQKAGVEHRCPIWENLQRLSDATFRERLTDLLELCDRNGFHLPIRQLLLLSSNMLLGHPKAQDRLLRCADVPKLVEDKRTTEASIYRNVFGGNLGRRANREVFEVLGRFGVGEETSNQIDNLLVFGSDDPQLKDSFDKVICNDPYYGSHTQFIQQQAEYLEGNSNDISQDFLETLSAQRQRIFFVISPELAKELSLWDLTVFHFAGEYLSEVVRVLSKKQPVERKILSRLIRGINRIFTGLLASEDQTLYLASSGSYSQARISRIQEYKIDSRGGLGGGIKLEQERDAVLFSVYLSRDKKVSLPLNLTRYEFLSRVAEGALPSNFSRECYEDILSYKSRLMRTRREFDELTEPTDNTIELTLLETDTKGRFSPKSISVKL